MDETTAPSGPSPDGIFGEMRRVGTQLATAGLLVPDVAGVPPLAVTFGPVRLTLWGDGPVVIGERGTTAETAGVIEPAALMALSGLLAGVADRYRMEKDPVS